MRAAGARAGAPGYPVTKGTGDTTAFGGVAADGIGAGVCVTAGAWGYLEFVQTRNPSRTAKESANARINLLSSIRSSFLGSYLGGASRLRPSCSWNRVNAETAEGPAPEQSLCGQRDASGAVLQYGLSSKLAAGWIESTTTPEEG